VIVYDSGPFVYATAFVSGAWRRCGPILPTRQRRPATARNPKIGARRNADGLLTHFIALQMA
jgi:hypothetical protein